VLALAPLAVHPDRQRRGVGTQLVELALSRAEVAGEPLVVVVGSPSYYGRFGFEPAAPLGVEAPAGMDAEHFMVRRLAADDGSHRGRVRYPPAFETVS
jgi:putative acetyltransferase